MNFLFLGNFSGFFSYFIFDFLNPFLINKTKKIKNKKKFSLSRGPRVHATWHARPRGSATRTRAAPTWHNIFTISIYLIHTYKEVVSLSYMGKGIRSL